MYSDSTATVVEIVHYGDVSDEIRNINETFVAASAHDLRPNVVSVPLAENVPINTAPESPPQSESVIKLPLDSISNHVRNEDLLWEDDLESALVSICEYVSHFCKVLCSINTCDLYTLLFFVID